MNKSKQKIYNQIDYSNEASLYASKLKLENVLSSSIKLDDETIRYYKEAIESINTILEYNILIEDDSIIIKNISGSIINEEKLYSGDGMVIGCYCDIKRQYSKNTAYFKVYNSDNFKKSTKVARITILNPSYIEDHTDDDGKGDWLLSSRECKALDKALHTIYNDKSIWEKICDSFNKRLGTNFDFGDQIPDFRNIKTGKEKRLEAMKNKKKK